MDVPLGRRRYSSDVCAARVRKRRQRERAVSPFPALDVADASDEVATAPHGQKITIRVLDDGIDVHVGEWCFADDRKRFGYVRSGSKAGARSRRSSDAADEIAQSRYYRIEHDD
jgi:hypothetical protein